MSIKRWDICMEWIEEYPDGQYVLLSDHAAEVERLEGELVEQARLLGMGGEREAKLMAENAALRERVRVLGEALDNAKHALADARCQLTGVAKDEASMAIASAEAALAQPQPCKTCGGTGEKDTGYVDPLEGYPLLDPCPDCQPQQEEEE